MKAPKDLTYNITVSKDQELLDERTDWETEWKQLSDFLLPGRGVYNLYTKPQKRKLTSSKVVNAIGEDALYVLTSGMHGALTSPSRPWFNLEWADAALNDFEPLKAWLQECTERLHTALHQSNFYNVINSFYIEYAGFGTACTYMGEDTADEDDAPFRFELLTAGEYAFTTDHRGFPTVFTRPIFMSQRQLYDRFQDTVSKECKRKVENNESGIDTVDLSVIEMVMKREYQDKKYTRVVYEMTGASRRGDTKEHEPLQMDGFYEFPYPLARWGTIGSDIYGIGPGSRALPDIKRLQEMEKAFLMATHKTINPPLNAPSRMRGKLNTLPGGYNYYANPNEIIKEIYQVNFDYQGVGMAVERVEERIRRNFYNDVFLTGSRDPNATPYKAREVDVREGEKMLRLGPVVERLGFEYFNNAIERGFNIMVRKDLMPALDPELQQMASQSGYNVSLVSPLATAQRAVAIQGISSFMGFLSQAAQFDQTVLDNANPDEMAREVAHINGVRIGVLRPKEEVKQLRAERARVQKAQQAREAAMEDAQLQSGVNAETANAQKAQSEAGLNLIEGQQVAEEMGL